MRSRITNREEPYYVLLDEVQYAISDEEMRGEEPPRLYGVLNGLLRMRNVDVYVTGSNSKMLSTNVMTEFRGRGDEVRVRPPCRSPSSCRRTTATSSTAGPNT
ncbi:AAA family ATPase [Bifidobacterium longum]